MSKDFYKILGVDENASKEDIKKAFRKKAKESHPDKGGDEEVFKKINEAYDVLGDDEKKSNYDRYGSTDQQHRQNPFGSSGFNMDDIFSQFGFGNKHQNDPKFKKGKNIRITLQVSLEDILNGVNKTIKLQRQKECGKCSGKGGHNSRVCMNCGGTGTKVRTTRTIFGQQNVVTSCTNCQGLGEIITDRCNGCGGNGSIKEDDTVNLQIPPGVYNGISLVQEGKGNFIRNGKPGDLEIIIQEIPHDKFVREGNNLHMTQDISVIDAILGCDIIIETLNKSFSIKIDKGVQNNKIYRMSGKGLPELQNNNRKGDLFIKINIKIPTNISEEESVILNELKKSNNFKI